MSIKKNILSIHEELATTSCKLIAVSKTKPAQSIKEAYACNQRDFGENKVQELVTKHETLPDDIRWHMIGHLQSNKVKYIASFVHMIHAVDSEKLLQIINQEAAKNKRIIKCLLQVKIATEETKYGLNKSEVKELIELARAGSYPNVQISGLMGMATNTTDKAQIESEFESIHQLLQRFQKEFQSTNIELNELSIGMSSDYKLAIKHGSTMIRIGSTIFGERYYP